MENKSADVPHDIKSQTDFKKQIQIPASTVLPGRIVRHHHLHTTHSSNEIRFKRLPRRTTERTRLFCPLGESCPTSTTNFGSPFVKKKKSLNFDQSRSWESEKHKLWFPWALNRSFGRTAAYNTRAVSFIFFDSAPYKVNKYFHIPFFFFF